MDVALALQLLGLGSVTAAALSIVMSALRLGISPMPSSGAASKAMVSLLPATLTGEIVELGSGWGGLAIDLARRCPAARVTGWEASVVPFFISSARVWLFGPSNLRIRRGDFFEQDLSSARVIVAYLWTGAMSRLGERLGPSTTLVTNTFALRGRTPDETVRCDDLYRSTVYRYGNF